MYRLGSWLGSYLTNRSKDGQHQRPVQAPYVLSSDLGTTKKTVPKDGFLYGSRPADVY